MKTVQDTYCTLEFLNEVVKLQKESLPHKVAYRIMKNLSNIYLDITASEFLELVKSNPYMQELLQRGNKTIKAKLNWKDEISFESNTDTVYFIHPNYIQNYKEIRKNTGSLIVSSDKNDITWLERLNNNRGYVCIVPTYCRDGASSDFPYQESWEEAIKTLPIKPVNSLIISDNYLFKEIELRKEKGLFSILRAIVPNDLKIPFHLAIFSYIGDKTSFSKNEADKLISEIKNVFGEEKIKVTIIIHGSNDSKKTTHDREILSNYHVITSGIGFSVIEKDKIKDVAKGHIEPVFHSLATTPENHMATKHFHFQTLQWLKKIYNKDNIYIAGDREHRMLGLKNEKK